MVVCMLASSISADIARSTAGVMICGGVAILALCGLFVKRSAIAAGICLAILIALEVALYLSS